MIFRNLFSISKAKLYLFILSFILISLVIYIVYNNSLKQSNNELEKFEERIEDIVKNLKNQAQGPQIVKEERKAPNYNFTTNWFHPEQPQWQRLITEFKGKEINALEIGVFEGKCSIWILENLFDNPKSVLVALDTFKGGVYWDKTLGSLVNSGALEQLEQTYISNIEKSGFKKQVQIIKGISHDGLLKLNCGGLQFDFIYIDGSHIADDVLDDAILTWSLLKVNGIMIFDDYLWHYFEEEYNNPKIAIDAFLACYAPQIELLEKNDQIAIRKVKRERPYTRV